MNITIPQIPVLRVLFGDKYQAYLSYTTKIPIIAICSQFPSICSHDADIFDPDMSEDHLNFRNAKKRLEEDRCSRIKPSLKDVIRRFYAIIPYFDKDQANTAFLHKYRATVYGMSEASDKLDKEVAYYGAVITPVIFLQQNKDMWCLMERFHRAIRLYQVSHPTEKRSALKVMQNLRDVNRKIRSFIIALPGPHAPTRTTFHSDVEDEELHDKKDIRYLKELIKNLG